MKTEVAVQKTSDVSVQVSETRRQSSWAGSARVNATTMRGLTSGAGGVVGVTDQAVCSVRRSHGRRETWRSAGRRRVPAAVPQPTLELHDTRPANGDNDDNDNDDNDDGQRRRAKIRSSHFWAARPFHHDR